MKREETRADLLRFLRSIQRPDVAPIGGGGDFDEHTGLVDAGLIDSLAVIQIISYLEETHGIDFRTSGLDPESLGSVAGILDLISLRKAA